MSVIFPAECYVFAIKFQETMVGNGNSMRVPPQITEDLCGAAEGSFGIDDPILAMQSPQEPAKLFRISQGTRGPRAAEFLPSIEALQTGAKFTAENPAQDLNGQKERIPRVHPVAVIRRQPSSRDDTVDMGMQQQVLPPGMQNANQADFGARCLGSTATSSNVWALALNNRS
jgi:hypothetical protein